MIASPFPESPPWLERVAAWLTPRRIRAHAIILALCLWGGCAVDFSTPGMFDRAGNIKFQDFLPLYISARLISQDRAIEIYNQQAIAEEVQAIVGRPTTARVPYLYGPQVALLFLPLTRFSFPVVAAIWVAISLLIYFVCLFLLWKSGAPLLAAFARSGECDPLNRHRQAALFAIAAIAFPPLFHSFVRGQISALVLACFTVAFLAFHADHDLVGGIALGFLFFKPQFLIAIPFVLLLSREGKPLAGLVIGVSAQLAIAWICFGSAVMRAYLDLLIHSSRWLSSAEPGIAAIQMHSLRSFWALLIPWPQAAFALYVLSSVPVIALATAIWKSSSPLAIRFSALVLATVLVNPHLFVYDLLVLAPVLLLLADWLTAHHSPALRLLLYLAFTLPLLGPLSRWTHLQLSVPVFVMLLWLLSRAATPGHKLASPQSRVV